MCQVVEKIELELGALLQEFDDVVEELKAPSHSRADSYQNLLEEAKSRTGQWDDSGVEDNDSGSEVSLGNSLNNSEEELHTAGITLAPKGMRVTISIFIHSRALQRSLSEL